MNNIHCISSQYYKYTDLPTDNVALCWLVGEPPSQVTVAPWSPWVMLDRVILEGLDRLFVSVVVTRRLLLAMLTAGRRVWLSNPSPNPDVLHNAKSWVVHVSDRVPGINIGVEHTVTSPTGLRTTAGRNKHCVVVIHHACELSRRNEHVEWTFFGYQLSQLRSSLQGLTMHRKWSIRELENC